MGTRFSMRSFSNREITDNFMNDIDAFKEFIQKSLQHEEHFFHAAKTVKSCYQQLKTCAEKVKDDPRQPNQDELDKAILNFNDAVTHAKKTYNIASQTTDEIMRQFTTLGSNRDYFKKLKSSDSVFDIKLVNRLHRHVKPLTLEIDSLSDYIQIRTDMAIKRNHSIVDVLNLETFAKLMEGIGDRITSQSISEQASLDELPNTLSHEMIEAHSLSRVLHTLCSIIDKDIASLLNESAMSFNARPEEKKTALLKTYIRLERKCHLLNLNIQLLEEKITKLKMDPSNELTDIEQALNHAQKSLSAFEEKKHKLSETWNKLVENDKTIQKYLLKQKEKHGTVLKPDSIRALRYATKNTSFSKQLSLTVLKKILFTYFTYKDQIRSLLPVWLSPSTTRPLRQVISQLQHHFVRKNLEQIVDGKEYHLKILQNKIRQIPELPTEKTSTTVTADNKKPSKKMETITRLCEQTKDLFDDEYFKKLPREEQIYLRDVRTLYNRSKRLDETIQQLTAHYVRQFNAHKPSASQLDCSYSVTSHWTSAKMPSSSKHMQPVNDEPITEAHKIRNMAPPAA